MTHDPSSPGTLPTSQVAMFVRKFKCAFAEGAVHHASLPSLGAGLRSLACGALAAAA